MVDVGLGMAEFVAAQSDPTSLVQKIKTWMDAHPWIDGVGP
jgi:hypothetical protein